MMIMTWKNEKRKISGWLKWAFILLFDIGITILWQWEMSVDCKQVNKYTLGWLAYPLIMPIYIMA